MAAAARLAVNPQTAGQINDPSNQLYGNYQQERDQPHGRAAGQLPSAAPDPPRAGQVGANAQALMSPYAALGHRPGVAGEASSNWHWPTRASPPRPTMSARSGGKQAGRAGGRVAAAQTALGTQQNIANLLNQGWGRALTPATALALSQQSQQGYNAASLLGGMMQIQATATHKARPARASPTPTCKAV